MHEVAEQSTEQSRAHLARGLLVVPVVEHHVVSADAHLAGLPERHDVAGAIHNLAFQVVENFAASGHANLQYRLGNTRKYKYSI